MIKKNCPECGNEVLNEETFCTYCGFSFRKKRKFPNKVVAIVIVCIVVLLSVILVLSKRTDEKKYAKNLIEKDLNTAIECTYIYYNLEQQICFVEFLKNNMSDIAMVNLDTKEIGYNSIMSKYLYESNKYSGNYDSDEYQRVAKNIIDYSRLYDTTAFFSAQNGNKNWEQIYP